MEKATAVNTCLGVLKGRDCIYLDQVKQDALNNLTFTGDINGHLISQCRDEKDWFPYTLTFRQVLAYFTCELDTYENMAGVPLEVPPQYKLVGTLPSFTDQPCHTFRAFRHKQDSTLVAEQTTIFSVYIFLRVNI